MERNPNKPLKSDFLNLPTPSKPLPQIYLEDGHYVIEHPNFRYCINAESEFTYSTKRKDPINILMRIVRKMSAVDVRNTYI